MKVLYDHQIFSIARHGGISRYFVELARHINSIPGVQARIVAPLNRSPCLSEQDGRVPRVGIDLSRLPGLPDRVARALNKPLASAYGRFANPDIVHETYYRPGRIARRTAKVIATFHDAIPERLPHLLPNLPSGHAMRQQALKRADHIICVSESTRRDLLEFFDVDPDRVSVVALGSSFRPSPLGPIDIGAPFFLHVGARYRYKGLNAFIRAFGQAALYRTHKLVSFSSKPWTEDELDEMTKSNVPLHALHRVCGDDDLLARYYTGADALVFPSEYEGFGIPLLEAMQCGCPVVTSSTSSMPEVAGEAGLFVTPGDSDSIAHALVQVASSAELRRCMVEKGKIRAKLFSWKRCTAETYAIYKEVLARS